MPFLLKKIKELESEIDNYLDMVIKGGLLFKQSIKYFMTGEIEEFESRLVELDKIESDADILRRTIESKLYEQTLIPDSRGDVLGLLESTDKALNVTSETLHQFAVEIPQILPEVKHLYIELADLSISALESMVAAVRAYFEDLTQVRDYINKVLFYESESDKIAEKIKRTVFRTDIKLSEKIHMRYFALHIENIADEAEDVCDRLAIAAIKRHV
jgi:predicted phosphate transport protein (TIGR00153 family)